MTRVVGWALATALLVTSCISAPPAPTPPPPAPSATVATRPAAEEAPSSTRDPDPAADEAAGAPLPVSSTAPATMIAPASWAFAGADGVETLISDTSRIVTLNGDINEVVYALGHGDAVVGNDLSATFPPETLDLPKIGYQRALNAEGILSLSPTLVIGNEQAGPPAVLEQVRNAGVPVVILPVETALDGAARKVVMVGEVLGAADRAEELARRIASEIAAAREMIPDRVDPPRVAFIYARGLDVLLLAGRDTPSESLITAAGAADAGAGAGLVDFTPLTAEGLAAADPDWLILTEDGLESVGGVDGLLEIPGVAQTSAGRHGRVLAFDDLGFLGLTPRVGAVLRRLVLSLYQDR